jgi:hypothetical protein
MPSGMLVTLPFFIRFDEIVIKSHDRKAVMV